MSAIPKPKFSIGEVAILQPPHPSARHLWGTETTILAIYPSIDGEDAMGNTLNIWSYDTDVSAPPPTDLPEDQHAHWLWCEYDLKKKYQPGLGYEELLAALSTVKV